jgi:DNA invertase Pin-like site-specific DNA recombinase
MQNLNAKVIGYARVSSEGQSLEGQIAELRAAGCTEVVSEKVSGKTACDRAALVKLLKRASEGDTIVVTKLDRFARSLKDLLNILDELAGRGVGFKALNTPIDTTSHYGRLVTQIFGAVAEFERSLIRERCGAGLERAKERGVQLGRRHKLNPHQRREALRLLGEGETQGSVARLLGCDQATISRLARAA